MVSRKLCADRPTPAESTVLGEGLQPSDNPKPRRMHAWPAAVFRFVVTRQTVQLLVSARRQLMSPQSCRTHEPTSDTPNVTAIAQMECWLDGSRQSGRSWLNVTECQSCVDFFILLQIEYFGYGGGFAWVCPLADWRAGGIDEAHWIIAGQHFRMAVCKSRVDRAFSELVCVCVCICSRVCEMVLRTRITHVRVCAQANWYMQMSNDIPNACLLHCVVRDRVHSVKWYCSTNVPTWAKQF